MLTHLLLKVVNVGSEWVLWVLVLLSFVNVAIVSERWNFFKRRKVDFDGLQNGLNTTLSQGDIQGAFELVAAANSIEEVVVGAGLRTIDRGEHACSEAMLNAKATERIRLDEKLAILGSIGSNSPFVGLLGTVLGIIKAAHDLGGEGDPSAAMAGIFEALVATAVGLFVAIPAIVSYNYFQRKVKVKLAHVEALSHLVLSTAAAIHHRKASGFVPPPTRPVKA